MAKRRSFGSAFLGFLRGLISFILVLILIAAVGINLIFSSDDSAPKIDIPNYRYTFFVNMTSDLKNIGEDSLCFIDHARTPEENTYVLCNPGNGNKILCLESITENGNGSLSYNVKADRMETLDTVYSLPASKIYGTVFNKDDVMGEIIVFVRSIKGTAIMFGAAFLLLILSIAAIKSKKSRYDDDLQEAELALEDIRRKQKNDEKKAEEHRKAMAEKAAMEAESALAAKVEAAVREAETAETVPAGAEQVPSAESVPSPAVPQKPVSDSDPAPFSFQEYKRKADEAAAEAVPAPAPVPEPVQTPAPASVPAEPQVSLAKESPAEPQSVSKFEFTDFAAEAPKAPEVQAPAAEPAPVPAPAPAEEKPVFQEVPLSVRPAYKYENLIQNFTEAAEIKRAEEKKAAEQAPVQTPAPAPVKKKAKPPVKKLDAESIDDLIRILEEEKKKLD